MAKNQKGSKADKNANGKCDKKNAQAVAPAPKKVKLPRVKNPAADYTPRAKNAETVQTVEAVWSGWCGLVDARGMRFRVSKETSPDGEHQFSVVSVVSTPVGTKLRNLKSPSTYVTIASLHLPTFSSKFKKGSAQYETQERIWKFFHELFVEMGLKVVPQKNVGNQHKAEVKTSDSVADLISGVPGLYSFEPSGPRAVFCVKNEVHAPQLANASGALLAIELYSVEDGHPLAGTVRKETYVPHRKLLFAAIPHFNGARAGDCQKLWEFLNGVASKYRRTVASKILKPMDASQGAVVGAPAITREENQVLRAA